MGRFVYGGSAVRSPMNFCLKRAKNSDYSPKCLEKLFGNSAWAPNRGPESGQDGSKEFRFGRLLAPEMCPRNAFSYFPNSFSTTFVNKGKKTS